MDNEALFSGVTRTMTDDVRGRMGAVGPPLWSSGQSSWLLTQRSWVRFSTLPDFSE
jgi:hypothetical protein